MLALSSTIYNPLLSFSPSLPLSFSIPISLLSLSQAINTASSSPFFIPAKTHPTFFMTLFVILTVPLLSFIFLSSAAYYKLLNLPTMMSFCRKITPHSLLGLTATTTAAPPTTNENFHHYIPSLTGGLLGLVTETSKDVSQRQHLVLESSSVKKQRSMPPLPSFLPPPATKTVSAGGGGDIGGFGFLDDVGGGKDGFVSCTESLGFESSDEIMRVDDQVELDDEELELSLMRLSEIKRSQWVRMRDKRSVDKDNNKFPPPISSLNKNGHPTFYLRPVRKDGRLELTEVRIHRPEILRAHREDGRLRLHLISHDDQEEESIEEGQEEETEEEGVDFEDISNLEEERENVETESSSVNDGNQWKMGMAGGEGFRRCQDVAGSSHHVHHHHHHNNHHVWSQQHCVV